MIEMSPRQMSEMMAKEVCDRLHSGEAPNPKTLAGMFNHWLDELVVHEHKSLLDELANLAFQETDDRKKAGYLKLARLVQSRMLPRSSAEAN